MCMSAISTTVTKSYLKNMLVRQRSITFLAGWLTEEQSSIIFERLI